MDEPLHEVPSLRRPGPLRCPKCRSELAQVVIVGTEVDRCTSCGGLWFDLLEHEQLRCAPGIEVLDSGDPATGARFDRVGLVHCPVDDQPMVRMVDRARPSLWFESCPYCHGVFFDAGEFNEFREDDFRLLFVRRRRPRPM